MLGDVNVHVSLAFILVQIVSQALRLKTIRIYRLHACPEIKTLVFFSLLSSFLLSFFWLLQALFSWYYQ